MLTLAFPSTHWVCWPSCRLHYHSNIQGRRVSVQAKHTLSSQSWIHLSFTVPSLSPIRVMTGLFPHYQPQLPHHSMQIVLYQGLEPPHQTSHSQANCGSSIYRTNDHDHPLTIPTMLICSFHSSRFTINTDDELGMHFKQERYLAGALIQITDKFKLSCNHSPISIAHVWPT